MLKNRIKKIEDKIGATLPRPKKCKTWPVYLKPGYENLEEEKKRMIEEIKAGKAKHPDGDLYSEENAYLFTIVIPVNKEQI